MGNESSTPFEADDVNKEDYETVTSEQKEPEYNGYKKGSSRGKSSKGGSLKNSDYGQEDSTSNDLQTTFLEATKSVTSKLDTSNLLDTMCGPFIDESSNDNTGKRSNRKTENMNGSLSDNSVHSDEYTEYTDEYTEYTDDQTIESSYASVRHRRSDGGKNYRNEKRRSARGRAESQSDAESDEGTESYSPQKTNPVYKSVKNSESNIVGGTGPSLPAKPLASSFAKRCYFTKAGIGKNTQHYEGLTLTGNVVLMLASAMRLKGCPTICDEDLRRVEQTYPNQFSRLPDELLLSSGWRRISKYCHFSNKPIPDGLPFFHSKRRLHPSTRGYYFLLASAVGMVRPIDVEPLTRDTLVLLETDYPTQCDGAPEVLIQDPDQWTLVDKFCFFSGGPINTKEDVYYQADFDGNPIFMLAFLSPSLTPDELYKLDSKNDSGGITPTSTERSNNTSFEPGLKSIEEVEEVESVYDLTQRDFDDLKLYHLGPCRALPQYILQPQAWTKILPPHFLSAKKKAILLAKEYQTSIAGLSRGSNSVDSFHVAENLPDDEPPSLSINGDTQIMDHSKFPINDPQARYQKEEISVAAGTSYHGSDVGESNYMPVQEEYFETSNDEIHGNGYPVDNQSQSSKTSHFATEEHFYTQKVDKIEEHREESFIAHQTLEGKFLGDSYDTSHPVDNHSSVGGEFPAFDSGTDLQRPSENVNPGTYRQDVASHVRDVPTLPVSTNEDNSRQRHVDNPPSVEHIQNAALPTSPDNKSGFGSDMNESTSSSAMRSAHELIRKNRLKRLDRHAKKHQKQHQSHSSVVPEDKPGQEGKSQSTWETGSDLTSVVSGSSVWTDTSNTDRSDRRALILGMAKARMKSNKIADARPIHEEESLISSDQSFGKRAPDRITDIDLTSDLD